MPKFDHRFDNQIQKKEDLRFLDIDTACDYAGAQYRMYGTAQNVIPAEKEDMFRVLEHPVRLPQAVWFIDENYDGSY